MSTALEPRYSVFVDQFLRHFNGGKAALAAGYSPKNAKQQACKLLAMPSIQAEIERRHTRTLARYGVSRARVVEEQAKVAFANMGDFIRFDGGMPVIDLQRATPAQMAAVAEITTDVEMVPGPPGEDGKPGPQIAVGKVRLKLHDKLRGLELLGRPFGLSNVNVRVTVDDQRPVLDDLSDDDLEALKELLLRALPAPMIEAVAVEINDEREDVEA